MRAELGDEDAPVWANHFVSLGEKLGARKAEIEADHTGLAHSLDEIDQGILKGRRIPCSTYRLQFNKSLTFRDARELVPYLFDLGISDCYASPLLKAASESSHGYDICDHSQLNPVLGSQQDFDAFSGELKKHGMGLLLDIVPNHIGIGHGCNLWWLDVMENGPCSIYASYFDIDWHPVKPELENKVLLPILGDQYGKVLESGELRLAYEEGAFVIHLYETFLPVAPHTYAPILSYQLKTLVEALGEDNQQIQELQSIITALRHLPDFTERDPEKMAERNREKEVIKRRLADLSEESPYVRAAIDTAVRAFNGAIGQPDSFDLLDGLLQQQVYRLAFWRVAAEEINYRRFFDVNALAAVRVGLPEVFQATHQLVLQLLGEGKITGLRVDHPDGLWDPAGYFWRLQKSFVLQQIKKDLAPQAQGGRLDSAVAAWLAAETERRQGLAPSWPLYVVAEKVLGEGEPLPPDWAIDGTTGYDFLDAVNGLFVQSKNRLAVDKIYSQFIEARTHFRDLLSSAKNTIMLESLASEINALSHQLERIAEKNRRYRDFTLNSLTFAIREVIACLPIYRTYITGRDKSVSERDRSYIRRAVAEARKKNPRLAQPIFDFIQDTLLLENVDDFREEDRAGLIDFVMKLQQVTGSIMAKGVEDTAFYVYNRLVSLNEVGGNPAHFGHSLASFHQHNVDRQRSFPHSLLTTSTHDTKRSEDVRARINVLSEIPQEWKTALARWSRLNAHRKSPVDGERAPDRNDEYLLYQTLLGIWPAEAPSPDEIAYLRRRLASYMLKATREAKVHTSWVNPSEEYEEAVQKFVSQLLDEGSSGPFLRDFAAFQRRLAFYGQLNSLAQVLLKLTSPGVPDIYQGTELWDFSLVDPDNRRPVDFQRRRSLLADLKGRVERPDPDLLGLTKEILGNSQDGRIKLYLTYQALHFRRNHERLFAEGDYIPLEAEGEKREHLCAYLRKMENEAAVAVAPRLVVGLTGGLENWPIGAAIWGDTRLPLPQEPAGARYRNVFTGEVLALASENERAGLKVSEVLGNFPVGLLERLEG